MEDLIHYEGRLAVAFALGNAKTRKKLIEMSLQNRRLWFPNLIDPSVIMGAGSTIIKDIEIPGTYVGVPTRRVNYEE